MLLMERLSGEKYYPKGKPYNNFMVVSSRILLL